MTTFEERAREAIRKMTADALTAVQEGGVYQQAQIERYTKQLLSSLSPDCPLNAKDVCEEGGAVRIFLLPFDVSSDGAMPPFRVRRFLPEFDTDIGRMSSKVFDLYEMLPAPRFRVTVIIEPLHEEEKQ